MMKEEKEDGEINLTDNTDRLKERSIVFDE